MMKGIAVLTSLRIVIVIHHRRHSIRPYTYFNIRFTRLSNMVSM